MSNLRVEFPDERIEELMRFFLPAEPPALAPDHVELLADYLS